MLRIKSIRKMHSARWGVTMIRSKWITATFMIQSRAAGVAKIAGPFLGGEPFSNFLHKYVNSVLQPLIIPCRKITFAPRCGGTRLPVAIDALLPRLLQRGYSRQAFRVLDQRELQTLTNTSRYLSIHPARGPFRYGREQTLIYLTAYNYRDVESQSLD